MNVTIKEGKLAIAVNIEEKLSASGKSLIIATSGGNKETEIEYKGRKVVVGLNVYVKAIESDKK